MKDFISKVLFVGAVGLMLRAAWLWGKVSEGLAEEICGWLL